MLLQKERSSLLKEMKDLREERAQLLAQLDKYKDCDPEVVEEMSEYTSLSQVLLTLSELNRPYGSV